MVQSNIDTQSVTEVPEDAGGLPQLNVIEDGTYTNQIAWLVLTFVVLYVVIAKIVFPKIGTVLAEREDNVMNNLDVAERLRSEAEDIKNAYEAAVADARAKAQQTILDTKADIQAEAAKVQADLDAKLGAQASDADARIAAAKDEALKSVGAIAEDVAKDIVTKLSGGVEADQKLVGDAVAAALSDVKGA